MATTDYGQRRDVHDMVQPTVVISGLEANLLSKAFLKVHQPTKYVCDECGEIKLPIQNAGMHGEKNSYGMKCV